MLTPTRPGLHRCKHCSAEQDHWAGRCPGCGDYNTLYLVAESTELEQAKKIIETFAPNEVANETKSPEGGAI